MKICTRFSLIIPFITAFYWSVTASSIMSVKRLENGSDKCDRYLCVDIPSASFQETGANIYDVQVLINQIPPNQNFSFPWRIKAFDIDNNYLGESISFSASDFSNSNDSNLRSITRQIIMYQKSFAFSPIEGDCYVDDCGLEHANITIVFKLFSGATEIDSACDSFDDPNLLEDSNILTETLKTCACPLREVHRNLVENKSNLPQGRSNIQEIKNTFNNLTQGTNKSTPISDVKIFPNPASSKIYIEFADILDKEVEFTLLSLDNKIISKTYTSFCERNCSLDVHNLPSGIYVLKYFSDHQVLTKKVIISN